MVAISYGKRFFRCARRLPKKQQKKLAELLEVVSQNPFHPLLHTKALSGEVTGLFSFRMTRDWRVTFPFLSPEMIQLIDVAIGEKSTSNLQFDFAPKDKV
ncbi:plasmid stabilization protein [Candidatus Wolfebacteria bacterium]|nr:plasmid stabilization protein [Candidatus Wolfebacteria bacterium]